MLLEIDSGYRICLGLDEYVEEPVRLESSATECARMIAAGRKECEAPPLDVHFSYKRRRKASTLSPHV